MLSAIYENLRPSWMSILSSRRILQVPQGHCPRLQLHWRSRHELRDRPKRAAGRGGKITTLPPTQRPFTNDLRTPHWIWRGYIKARLRLRGILECETFRKGSLSLNHTSCVIQRLWVIWGQCCPRVAAAPNLPNGPITQLGPYLTQKPGIYLRHSS